MAVVAAAPVISSTWIPEDDLLLKNSVEAGASLESLARGAVQFSRRFTFSELRDRWHSLLYDPDISAQASKHMVEFEISGSNPSLKFNRLNNSKGTEDIVGKRKIGSIHRQYYAMRKKMRCELLNSTDLGFFDEPNLHGSGGHGGGFQEHLTLDNVPPDGNCMLGDCISNGFELQETDLDILRHAFPEAMDDIADTPAVNDNNNAFHTGCQDSVADNRILRNNRFYGFPEDVSPLIRDDGRCSFDQNNDTPHLLQDNSNLGKRVGIEVIGPSQALSKGKLFEIEDSKKKILPICEMNEDAQNLCSGYGGKQHFNSPDSDRSGSFHKMGFSSPLPRLPLWKTMEDISAPAMPVNLNNRDRTQGEEPPSTDLDDGDCKRKSPSGYDGVDPGPLLRDGNTGVDFVGSSAVSEGEFADLSDSLLNFANDDGLLFMAVDEKETMDKSCSDNLNLLLLSSPSDVREGDISSFEPKTSVVSDSSVATLAGLCLAGLDNIASSNQRSVCHSEVNVRSTSLPNPDPLELKHGKIFCNLNTEDPDIPCNDDIFLLIHPTVPTISYLSSVKPIPIDSVEPLSPSVDEERDLIQQRSLMKKGKDPLHSFVRAQMVELNMSSESFPRLVGSAFRSELSNTKSHALILGEASKSLRDPSQYRSIHATASTPTDRVLERNAVDTPATFKETPLKVESGSREMNLPETMNNFSTSCHESESDNDVPCYSDVEAMILEMDLGPYDRDSHISRQVSKYQYEEAKRTIIRLEQCARSALQRAMASQGAIAILYGRHLKHYIRKTEVILGRSTNDINVDIDLRKEGRANNVSRRQAIIKMELDGSFSLKNLGKSSISVNGKAVASGESLGLNSSCLIEIKGMSFVFEINHKYVKLYLHNITKRVQGKRKHDRRNHL